MARIRTIKPEFPQSESMGRVSRDSRLCFLLLFTLSDDHGKLRGNSRMLASLLYPYDDDASKHIEKWLTQLQSQGCVVRYQIGGDHYIKIANWESHQKVDKPSRSKIPDPPEDPPPPREDSRTLVAGSEDQRIKDQGSEDQGGEVGACEAAPKRGTRLQPDWTLPQEWGEWAERQGMKGDDIVREGEKFKDYWTSLSGAKATKTDWFATWRNWIRKHLEEYAK